MEPVDASYPLFSVLIPSYNRREILWCCLQALARQTLPKEQFETIVVDDGSTDGTSAVLESWQKQSPYAFRFFQQENRKQGAARNLGARHAKGRYLLFLGDDILATESLLEEHQRFHQSYGSSADIAVLGYIRWSPEIKATRFLAASLISSRVKGLFLMFILPTF